MKKNVSIAVFIAILLTIAVFIFMVLQVKESEIYQNRLISLCSKLNKEQLPVPSSFRLDEPVVQLVMMSESAANEKLNNMSDSIKQVYPDIIPYARVVTLYFHHENQLNEVVNEKGICFFDELRSDKGKIVLLNFDLLWVGSELYDSHSIVNTKFLSDRSKLKLGQEVTFSDQLEYFLN